MEEHNLTNEQILAFSTALFQAERSQATVEKYLRSVRAFSLFLDGQPVTKDIVLAWKKHLQREENYSPSTVNASLAALNCLFSFLGWTDCRTHYLKIQRRLFRETGRELDRADYELCKKLLKYARKQKITSGEIFLTGGGKPMSRCQIWAEMKRVCKTAGVDSSKVFPHNLRHLFATVYYRIYKDIVKLADILGHSSIETTRIYLLTTGQEHRQQLERLRLVL